MHYIIQENVFKEFHYTRLEETLKRGGFTYTTVRCFPFIDRIVDLKDIPEDNNFDVDDLPEYDPKREDVFCFGALKLARIASQRKWKPGSMMNDNHDYIVYKDHWKENLLNYDSKIFRMADDFGWVEGEIKFIRPTQDTKSFTGQTFTKIEWEEGVERNLHNFKNAIFNEDTLVQVSTPKTISKEIRFWVVNKKVITGSTYRDAGIFNINAQVYPEEYAYAQSMVDIFQLNECFVIDICVTDKGFKIVEAGCLNAAGFYNSSLDKLITSLEEFYI